MMKNLLFAVPALAGAFCLLSTTSCNQQKKDDSLKQVAAQQSNKPTPALTKDMFYKDGVFDKEAAKQAYIDMMERLNYPVSDNMRENLWAEDFGLGDFPAVGMGGIFWANDEKTGVFGHEILLLPNQMLIEHYHVVPEGKDVPAKNECWQARAGTSYCFGEEGVDASTYPAVKVPDSQKDAITVNKVTEASAKKGNIVWLNKLEARHYQIAGPEGAVVTEYGAFHSGDGVKFTNKNANF